MLHNNIFVIRAVYSPSDIRFYVCFDSNNHFVVMYG